MVIPAEASEGHVQLGAVTLSRTAIDAQPQQFKNVVITDELMKKSLNWIHERLCYITRSYAWNLGMIDKDAFIPVRLLVSKLQNCWNASSSDHSTILYPTKHHLSLFLLTDISGDFEQWAGISPIHWACFFQRVHKYVAKGERSVLSVSLRESNVQPLVRTMLFEHASVTHVRNNRRHASRFVHKAIQEKTYNHNPTVICGTNVGRMIQSGLVPQHMCNHFVLEADVPPRTH